jgi:hypothetical protein
MRVGGGVGASGAALVLVLNHRQRDDHAEQDITESQ